VFSLISIKDYIYAGVIVGLIALGVYLRIHLIDEGEAKVKAAVAAAAQAQEIKDAVASQTTVEDLNSEIAELRGMALNPVPIVRLCPSTGGVRQASTPAGTIKPLPAPSGGVRAVPEGNTLGPDLGPVLFKLARAADLISAHDRACTEWATKIAQ
jgi:hypothetical protein